MSDRTAMPWVRFVADFDFKPMPQMTLAFRAGEVRLVTTACARVAIGKGVAERSGKPTARADAVSVTYSVEDGRGGYRVIPQEPWHGTTDDGLTADHGRG